MVVPAALVAMTAAQGAMGLGQMASSASMRARANRNFDKFQVPDSINNMLDVVHGLSSQTELPGADIYRNRVKGQLAQGVETSVQAAESSTDVLGAVRDMFKSYSDFEQNMAVKGAEQQRSAKMAELDVLKTIGDYETQEWVYNELYPYMQGMNAAGQVGAAGGANLNSALSSGMSLGMASWDMKQQDKMFEQWKDSILNQASTQMNTSNGGYDYGR